MSMRILVPLDGSPFSELALPYACEIAQRARAVVHLVRVHLAPATTSAELASTFDPALNDQLWREANADLANRAAWAENAFGIATRADMLSGPIVPAITTYAADQGIDLIVMTTHGRSGLSRALLGSVADALIRVLSVPALILRPKKGAPEVERFQAQRVLIPLDGSPASEEMIDSAVELGWLSNAHYTLVQIVAPPLADTYATTVAAQMSDHEIEHMRAQSLEYLQDVAGRLRRVGLQVETVVGTHADIAGGIVQESIANDADLIAMTTHGRSGWKRLALGSVAQTVLHNTGLPLLVLRSLDSPGARATRLEEESAAC